MPINDLYHTWFLRIRQLWPNMRVTRQRLLVRMLVGILISHSVDLTQIARKIPGQAKLLSKVRRLSRFLANPAIEVRQLYAGTVRQLLAKGAAKGEVRLIVDTSKVGFTHQLLMVAMAYRKRALPIAWAWVHSKRGHSSAQKQMDLLKRVQQLLPNDAQVLLVGDTEFESGKLQKQLEKWRWKCVLRQKANNLVKLPEQHHWQPFSSLVEQAGQSVWFEKALLTGRHACRVNLLAHWEAGEKEPWLLATNLPTRQAALRAYRRRMWIEEMFGDMKGHGFDLESTHLRHADRLSRLTFVVALLYVWLVTEGSHTIKNGKRHLVDRKERRDLSIFQIGWRYIDRLIVNEERIPIHLCPIF